MALLPVDEALKRILAEAQTLPESEEAALDDGDGRVLAADLVARRNQPPFAASAMDGYAVRAADTAAGSAVLDVIGQAAAGHAFSGRVGNGQAVRIFTGAPVPPGADAILIQENAETLDGDRIRAQGMVRNGAHVRAEGLDFTAGDTVLKAGMMLDPGRLTLAAAMNFARVAVVRRPRVAIIATGDELVRPGDDPRDDQIIASNSFGVGAIARACGATVIDLGIVPDRQDSTETAIDRALSGGADILVTLGGASVGDHDLVQRALVANGMTLDFWKIAMRPGKPLMSGRLDAMRVLGLPGNPVSSLVCSHLFLKPLIRRLAGLAHADDLVKGRLGADLPANDERQDYMRATLQWSSGEIVAHPFKRQDSSMTRTFADADGLIVRPPYAPSAATGDPCDILVLRRQAR